MRPLRAGRVRPRTLVLASILLAPRGAPCQLLPVPVPDTVAPLVEPAVEAADRLFLDDLDAAGALLRLEARLEVAPDDFGARWRAARAALAIGVTTESRDPKLAWLRAAVEHAERALAQRPDDPDALVWAAACKGRLAVDLGGVRERARLGEEVWELTHRLLAIDSLHPLGNDVLGKLHQEVSRLGAVQRFFARTFMDSEVFRNASWEKSEEHLQRALSSDPGFVLFYLDLGETYLLQGKDEEARGVFRDGLAVPDRYPTDRSFKEQMRRRLEETGR